MNGNNTNISKQRALEMVCLSLSQDITEHSELQLSAVLKEVERNIILNVYAICGDNQSEASRRLRMSRTALIYKLQEYGVLKKGAREGHD